MTQNDIVYLQEALAVKNNALIQEIVSNYNTVMRLEAEKTKTEEAKKLKKESK